MDWSRHPLWKDFCQWCISSNLVHPDKWEKSAVDMYFRCFVSGATVGYQRAMQAIIKGN